MISTPDIDPPAEWLDAWEGYELHLMALGRSPATISSRRSEVLVMARHATAKDLLRHAWAHYMLSDGAQEHDLMHLAGWTTTRQLGRYGAGLARERALAAGKRHQVSSIVRSGRSAR